MTAALLVLFFFVEISLDKQLPGGGYYIGKAGSTKKVMGACRKDCEVDSYV